MSDSIKERTISSLMWKLMERAGNQIILLVVQVVLARLLSPSDFGVLAIIMVFVDLAGVFVQSGLGAALVQSAKMSSEDCSTVFWISFAMSFVLFLIIFICSPFISGFYDNASLLWPLRMLSITLFFNAYNLVQVAIVQRSLDFRRTFWATAWSVCISGPIGIIAAFFGMGIWALVMQQLSYQAVNCASLYYQTRWVPRFEFNANRAKQLFSFGWKMLGCNLLSQGYQSLYDLVVGAQFSVAQLGLVSQGKKYPSALGNMLDGAVQPVMMSAISRVQSNVQRVRQLTRRALRTSTYIVVPCMTLFAVAAEPIVRIVLGDQWLDCIPFMQMYCVVYALLPIHSSNLSALCGMGRSDINLGLEIAKKVIGITALCIGAFVARDVYVLVATAIVTGVISSFINAYPNKRLMGYSYIEQVRDVGPAFLLSLAAGFVAYVTGSLVSDTWLVLCVETGVFALIYLGLSAILNLEVFRYLIDTAREFFKKR